MVRKKEFLWNSIASVAASALSAVLLLFATRMNGSTQAGLLAITFATATIFNAIGDFGMRVFQVTDTKGTYSFHDYLFARIFVAIAMVILIIGFTFVNGYEVEKALLCILFVLYRFVEVISETYQGELQLKGKLDVAAQSVVYRTIGAIIIFGIVDIISKNILLAAGSMIVWALFISVVFDMQKIKIYVRGPLVFHKDKVIHLVKMCFPTFLSTILNLYIINAPKYAIDNLLTYDDQAIFNIIFLPTFTINLLSIFVLKPILLSLGTMWNDKRYQDFRKILVKISVLILTLTLFVEVICFFIGIPMLQIIYGIDLQSFKADLLILVVSGGFSALSVMLFYALTTMRCQKQVVIPYVVSGIAAVILCTPLVKMFGIKGAAISSVAVTFILALSSLVIVIYQLKRKSNLSTGV